MNNKSIKRLVALANRLDSKGLSKEADSLDGIIRMAANLDEGMEDVENMGEEDLVDIVNRMLAGEQDSEHEWEHSDLETIESGNPDERANPEGVSIATRIAKGEFGTVGLSKFNRLSERMMAAWNALRESPDNGSKGLLTSMTESEFYEDYDGVGLGRSIPSFLNIFRKVFSLTEGTLRDVITISDPMTWDKLQSSLGSQLIIIDDLDEELQQIAAMDSNESSDVMNALSDLDDWASDIVELASKVESALVEVAATKDAPRPEVPTFDALETGRDSSSQDIFESEMVRPDGPVQVISGEDARQHPLDDLWREEY